MVEGLCFNCLSSSHRVDSCKTPTKCWRCRRSGHTSFSCPATHRIVSALNKRHRLGLIARPAPSRKIIRQLPPPLPWLTSTSREDRISISVTYPSRRKSGTGLSSLKLTLSLSGLGKTGRRRTLSMSWRRSCSGLVWTAHAFRCPGTTRLIS
jgi:hypothetical protein